MMKNILKLHSPIYKDNVGVGNVPDSVGTTVFAQVIQS